LGILPARYDIAPALLLLARLERFVIAPRYPLLLQPERVPKSHKPTGKARAV